MHLRRCGAIAGHELRTQLRGPLFWVLLLLLLAAVSTLNPVAMIRGGDGTVGGVRAVSNSMYALAPTFAMSGFFVYPFFAALMAGLAVIRDDEANVGDVLHSTPLTAAEYLWGKFAGVAGALGVALIVHVILVMAFRQLGIAGVAVGPFRLANYLVPALVFTAPGMLAVAGLAFFAGVRTRRPMVVYAVPTGVFLLTVLVCWNWRPAGIDARLDGLLMALDPSGVRWLLHSLFAEDRGFQIYNTTPVPFDATILLGRLILLASPLLLVTGSIGRFRQSIGKAGASDRAARPRPAPNLAPVSRVRAFDSLRNLRMTTRSPRFIRGAATIMNAELRELSRQPALYLFSLFLMAVVLEAGGTQSDAYGDPVRLSAGAFAVTALPVVTILVTLYLLFVVVESMHRDLATGFEPIAFASPISTGAMLTGKALASGAVIGWLTGVCIIAGAGWLALLPGSAIDLWPLVLVFGGVLGPTLILWTALVTALMAVLRHRTGTLAVGIAALVLTGIHFMSGTMTWVTNWPVWGALRWSDFGVFPLNGSALLVNRLLALALAALLGAIAVTFFARTERDITLIRARFHPASLGRLTLRLAPFALLPTLIATFLGIQVHTGFQGAEARGFATDQRPLALVGDSLIPPTIRHVDLDLTLDPVARGMTVRGTYLLVNETGHALGRLPFTIPQDFGPVRWEIGGTSIVPVVRAGLQLLTPPAALEPGDSLALGFAYQMHHPRGYTRNGGGTGTFILPAGVVLTTRRGAFLPLPGYQADAPEGVIRPAAVSTTSGVSRAFNHGKSFSARIAVNSPRGFVVNSVGRQVSESADQERTRTVWKTVQPVGALNLVGGALEVRREGDVAVFYHHGHSASAGRILRTLRAAHTRYTEWFSPLPWRELRLSEFPDLETGASSYPGNITFAEGLGFLSAGSGATGLPFAVTAHETAHQWWGHLFRIGEGPGTGLLVEGMADYATLLLAESELGPEGRMAFARRLESEYLAQRRPTEHPILATDEGAPDDEVVLQKKGAWALWMLDQSLGREQMLAGLREFIRQRRGQPDLAVPRQLLAALRHQAADTASFDRVVAQWFEDVVLPEIRVGEARCVSEEGLQHCSALVENVGSGTAAFALAAVGTDSAGQTPILCQTTVVLAAGQARRESCVTLGGRPERMTADPEVLLLQRNRDKASMLVP